MSREEFEIGSEVDVVRDDCSTPRRGVYVGNGSVAYVKFPNGIEVHSYLNLRALKQTVTCEIPNSIFGQLEARYINPPANRNEGWYLSPEDLRLIVESKVEE